MEGINLVYKPLEVNSVYSDRVVILCDNPHKDKEESFNRFKAQYSRLVNHNQFYKLPVSQIESYYPTEWKNDNKLKSHQKRNLAKKVANSITQEIFEKEMIVIFEALTNCWTKAHKVATNEN